MKVVTFTDQQYQLNMQMLDIAIKASGLQGMASANQVLMALGSATVIEDPASSVAGASTPTADGGNDAAPGPGAPPAAPAVTPAADPPPGGARGSKRRLPAPKKRGKR